MQILLGTPFILASLLWERSNAFFGIELPPIEIPFIPTCPDGIVINELEYDNVGDDTNEWIELYDGGRGNTGMDRLWLAAYNYATAQTGKYDLNGKTTDANGYYVANFPSNGMDNDQELLILMCGDLAPATFNVADVTSYFGMTILDVVLYEFGQHGEFGDELVQTFVPNMAISVYQEPVNGVANTVSRCNCDHGWAMNCFSSKRPPTPGEPNCCPGDPCGGTTPAPVVCPTGIMINEVEYDNVGSDTNEWVELYDGGVGNTPLDGLVLAGYDGGTFARSGSLSLMGMQTDANGYYVATFGSDQLQNDEEAVMLLCIDAAPASLSPTTFMTLDIRDGVLYEYGGNVMVSMYMPHYAIEVRQEPTGGSATSLSRCNCNDYQSNACFESNRPPTPGAKNFCPGDTIATTTTTKQITVATTAPVVCPTGILINEVEYDNVGSDTNEWVELYDGGVGNTPLDGLILAGYDGGAFSRTGSVSLMGMQTDANGYYVATFGSDLLENDEEAVMLLCTDSAPAALSPTTFMTLDIRDGVLYEYGGNVMVQMYMPHYAIEVRQEPTGGSATTLSRCNCNDFQSNACFESNRPPTPGAENLCPGDTTTTATTTELMTTAPAATLEATQQPETTVYVPAECPTGILINELEYDNVGADKNEWVELYDGGVGNTRLDGLILAGYNGGIAKTAELYLTGQRTDADGYYVATFGTDKLENDEETILLLCGESAPGEVTPVDAMTLDIRDGVLYEYSSNPIIELYMPFFAMTIYQEPVAGAATTVSRCYCQDIQSNACFESMRPPTPGSPNSCPVDTTLVASTIEEMTSTTEELTSTTEEMIITTTESPTVPWSECPPDSGHPATPYGQLSIQSCDGFFERRRKCSATGEWMDEESQACSDATTTTLMTTTSTVSTSAITEMAESSTVGVDETTTQEENTSPDIATTQPLEQNTSPDITPSQPLEMTSTESSAVITTPTTEKPETTTMFIPEGCPSGILINELEYDNVGDDTNEWVELYDGGVGNTQLFNLILVGYKGGTIKSGEIHLTGKKTDANGYYIATFGSDQLGNDMDTIMLLCEDSAPDELTPMNAMTINIADGVLYEYSHNPIVAMYMPGYAVTVNQEPVDGAATTISRCNCDTTQANACFESLRPPTPGSANSCPGDTTMLPTTTERITTDQETTTEIAVEDISTPDKTSQRPMGPTEGVPADMDETTTVAPVSEDAGVSTTESSVTVGGSSMESQNPVSTSGTDGNQPTTALPPVEDTVKDQPVEPSGTSVNPTVKPVTDAKLSGETADVSMNTDDTIAPTDPAVSEASSVQPDPSETNTFPQPSPQPADTTAAVDPVDETTNIPQQAVENTEMPTEEQSQATDGAEATEVTDQQPTVRNEEANQDASTEAPSVSPGSNPESSADQQQGVSESGSSQQGQVTEENGITTAAPDDPVNPTDTEEPVTTTVLAETTAAEQQQNNEGNPKEDTVTAEQTNSPVTDSTDDNTEQQENNDSNQNEGAETTQVTDEPVTVSSVNNNSEQQQNNEINQNENVETTENTDRPVSVSMGDSNNSEQQQNNDSSDNEVMQGSDSSADTTENPSVTISASESQNSDQQQGNENANINNNNEQNISEDAEETTKITTSDPGASTNKPATGSEDAADSEQQQQQGNQNENPEETTIKLTNAPDTTEEPVTEAAAENGNADSGQQQGNQEGNQNEEIQVATNSDNGQSSNPQEQSVQVEDSAASPGNQNDASLSDANQDSGIQSGGNNQQQSNGASQSQDISGGNEVPNQAHASIQRENYSLLKKLAAKIADGETHYSKTKKFMVNNQPDETIGDFPMLNVRYSIRKGNAGRAVVTVYLIVSVTGLVTFLHLNFAML